MDKKRILVTGSKGQLGSELRVLSEGANWNFFFVDIDTLDITDENAVETFFIDKKINYCINCAAYTAVDQAENNQEAAYKVNVIGAEVLAKVTEKTNSVLFHISTDFVFGGEKLIPYNETDQTSPLSVYGKTKLEGEKAIEQNTKRYYIIRTAWLYSSFGNNFVKTMLNLAKTRDSLGIVVDQVGTPTYAKDLAQVILTIIEHDKEEYGVLHFSNEGVASWYDFAKTIFNIKDVKIEVKPISTFEYPTPAKRPQYSVMDKSKIKNTFNISIPYWQDSLINCLSLIES
ncbi:dTDP-4-dehydrorhamnose reductase [Flammeovirga agarivorans]|uniref:dTDP-4-dehydrorhamnose reductase n=1 Tax=Flammeovirga agarivorans TaxID=2726742 RepID=A0A7X8SMX4_9BACT|nr:dTDP-4-dehydrorhamnose reductase [Flammeovirga agarivorans]NLR93082.1 dTDP-4-dehydrorhamnose reductase [Flammeovirga agarivorans]